MRKHFSVIYVNRAGVTKRVSEKAPSVNDVYKTYEKKGCKIVSVVFVSFVVRKKNKKSSIRQRRVAAPLCTL